MSNHVITEKSARTYRNDRAGNRITVDVRAGSRKATIVDARGRKRTAEYRMQKNSRYGYVVEKGYGYRVEQPRSISQLPKGYVASRNRGTPSR